ncbi:hypothetical protein POF50_025815 [Streptomyces sp. SL13]|uniref:Peptidoglycan binding-like domain-containing protein n=1 Tax=Streptantibioticus silvisoli TaxID=2705255 RepID=A0AA90KB12_9ACTN|nr:hypothetical protein [Streptantibioticus silvisoli]MDI5972717.1 hypothetical protein [Streptantibioticus silvisoli]
MAGVVRTRARAGLLVAVSVLPLLLGAGTAAATGPAPAPPAPAGVVGAVPVGAVAPVGMAASDAAGGTGGDLAAAPATGAPAPGPVGVDAGQPVPLDALVPGPPLPDGTADTPDPATAPRPPGATAARSGTARTEFVPADDADAVRALDRTPLLRPVRGFCSRHTGPYQEQVARFLHLPPQAGGPARQTPVSCAAIRRYQRDHGIQPAIGFAGPVTWAAMRDDGPHARPQASGPSSPTRSD